MNTLTRVYWLTGTTASGKTTLGKKLHQHFLDQGFDAEFLDGEELRKFLDREYGFSAEERFKVVENIVRVVKDFQEQGKTVVVSTISHKAEMRLYARENLINFNEVYIQCSIETCAKRDYKDHYRRAFAGEYEMFVGVTEPYEQSENPDIVVSTEHSDLDRSFKDLISNIKL